LRRFDDRGQLYVIEAIIVGVLVFVAITMVSINQLPTTPGTFEQGDLERLTSDTLVTILARPADLKADGSDTPTKCNDPAPCAFASEFERMVSKVLGYEGTVACATSCSGGLQLHDTSDIKDYFDQTLPDGASYIISLSNGRSSMTIFPAGVVPTGSSVVTGAVLMSPNWAVNAACAGCIGAMGRQNMIALRLGEFTGFQPPASIDHITDPLGRTTTNVPPIATTLWKNIYSNPTADARVPNDAILGTHLYCTGPAIGTCTAFSVVGESGFGAFSPVLSADRDFSAVLKLLGAPVDNPLTTANKYLLPSGQGIKITGADGALSAGDRLYVDLVVAAGAGANRVDAGDLRITSNGANMAGGTFVKAGDGDVNAALNAFTNAASTPPIYMRPLASGTAGVIDDGEDVYFHLGACPCVVSANDRRLSRVGPFAGGSTVAGADFDVGRTLDPVPFTGFFIRYADMDNGNTVNPGETVYMDLQGNGQVPGVEPYDVHLTPLALPPKKNTYEARLVVWFGV
jgi:hypothetical protein